MNKKRLFTVMGGDDRYIPLYEDDFTDALAAGSVNGTNTTDGNTTRTVVDTESKLLTTGGYLQFLGGKASPDYGDPGYWMTAAIPRINGRALITSIIAGNDQSNIIRIGFDNGKTGDANIQVFVFGSNSEIKASSAADSLSAKLADWYLGEKLYLGIVLRSSGADYWMRRVGGNWTKLFSHLVLTTTPLYAALNNYNMPAKLGYIYVADVNAGSPAGAFKKKTNVPTTNFLAYGDSKTLTSGESSGGRGFPTRMSTFTRDFLEIPTRIGVGGQTVASMKLLVDAQLAAASGTPEFILCNLGANDAASMPEEAAFKTNYQYIFDAMHTKWASVKIYVMRIWNRAQEANSTTLDGWIDDLVTANAFVYAGPDERIFLENGDAGVTYMADDAHPNSAGYDLTAAQWRTAIGF